MKILKIISLILFVLLNYSCIIQSPVSAQQGQGFVSQVFYDELEPYGQWTDYPDYGYVWIPQVGSDFSPYSTSGHWVMSEYGWAWASDYTWGWAPFHYGRWDYDDYYGWFWVPDNEWGPAWVTWRNANGYYGWTPLRPGISANMSFGSGYRDVNRWNFVRYSDFGKPDMDRYYISRDDNDRIIRNSVVINNTFIDNRRNTTYIAGPTRGNVQRATGKRINSVVIRDYDKPGQMLDDNQLQLYRPPEEHQSHKPAPTRITKLKDVRPARERNDTNQRNMATPTENNRSGERQAQPQQQIDNQRREQQNQQQQSPEQIEIRRQSQPQQEVQPSNKKEQQRIEQPQQQNEIRKQEQQPAKEQLRQPVDQQEQRVINPSVDKRAGRQQKATKSSENDKKKESDQKVKRRRR